MSITQYFERGAVVAVDFGDGTPVVPAAILASRYSYNAGLGEEVTHFHLEDLVDGGTFCLTLDEMGRYAQVVQ